MKEKQYDIIYFLGIGGIGMSALARWFMLQGKRVAGYDRTPTILTSELEKEGMEIHYNDAVEHIPAYVRNNRDSTLVIVTPAIPANHSELNYLLRQGYVIKKRAEVLGLISRNHRTLAVAGTHGKTTTSSMIAHILKSAGRDMVAFLGGVTANYQSNLVLHGEPNKNTLMVAEADEFDRSFLHLHPWLAVVTSADADHLDIYGNHQAMLSSYKDFIRQVQQYLVIHDNIATLSKDVDHLTKYTYGINRGQFFADNVRPAQQVGFFEFDLHGLGAVHPVSLGVPGFHNVENAVAAAAACHLAGVPAPVICKALAHLKAPNGDLNLLFRLTRWCSLTTMPTTLRRLKPFCVRLKPCIRTVNLQWYFSPISTRAHATLPMALQKASAWPMSFCYSIFIRLANYPYQG